MDEANPMTSLGAQLGEIPHSLQLYDLFKVKDDLCRAILKRLQSERERPSDGEDPLRSFNFTSLLLFRLKQREEALAENSYVLRESPKNVTAMVNNIYMKFAMAHEREALDQLKILKNLWSEGDLVVKATAFAEEAYCLSRIRPMFYLRSIDLFEKAIKMCPHMYLWKFGCAIVYKRCLGTSKCIKGLCPEKLKEFCNLALKYICEVIQYGNDCLKARSWTCLGELISTFKKPVYPLTNDIVETVNTDIRYTAEDCFDNALRSPTAEKDEIILERCGNGLRFVRQSSYIATLQECYKLLIMAYRLRPTAYVCDKLATVLLQLQKKHVKPDTKPLSLGPGYRRHGRGFRHDHHHGKDNSYSNYRNANSFRGPRGYDKNYFPDSNANYFENQNSMHQFSGKFNQRGGQDPYQGYIGHGRGRGGGVRARGGGRARGGDGGGRRGGGGRGFSEERLQMDANRQPQLNPYAAQFVPQHTEGVQQNPASPVDSLSFGMKDLTLASKPTNVGMQKKKFKKAISSPQKVKTVPRDDPLINEAVHYLNASLSLSEECNNNALYQLGLLHRRLEEIDKAIEYFLRILRETDTTLYHKINAYEQIGFCHLDKSKNPALSDTESQNEKEEGKFMLKRAVEEAARLVASLPTMRREDLDSWESYPTLKQLLSNAKSAPLKALVKSPLSNNLQPEHMKDIARLCQLIGNNRESLEWYTKLQQIDPDDMEALHDVVVTHIRLQDFKTAQNSFNVLMGSSEGRQLLEDKPHLFNQVYLGTIRHLMSRKSEEDMDQLKMSCRTLFDCKHRGPPSSANDEESDGAYEIFMLNDPNDTEAEAEAEALQKWLSEKCALSVTRNDEDVNEGAFPFMYQEGFIQSCKIVIVVLSSGQLDKHLKTILSIAVGEKGSDSIVSVRLGDLELPTVLKGSLSVKRPQTEEGDPEHQIFPLKCFMATLGLDFDTFQWIE